MKRIFTLTILLNYLFMSTAHAAGVYIHDSSGGVVLNGAGECWRSGGGTLASETCVPAVSMRPQSLTPSGSAPQPEAGMIAVPAVGAAPGVMDNVMGNIEASLPPKEELAPAAVKEAPPQEAAPGAAATTGGSNVVIPAASAGETVTEAPPGEAYPSATAPAVNEGTAASAPEQGDGSDTTPEWMKQSSVPQPTPPPRKASAYPPWQVMSVLIFDVLLFSGKFSHLWNK